MTTIKQNIPTFLNGISQQPDKKKIPTQLKDAINTYPDYALGMLKRPGGKFVSDLYNAEDISTTIASSTHNGTGHASRTVNRYVSVPATGGSGSGATFNIHAIAVGEVNTFTHNGVSATNRTAGTYYIANAGGSASGTGADFKVVVDADGRPNVLLDVRTSKTGGAGYAASETITIADSSLGNGGAAALVITVATIHAAVGLSVSLSSGGKGYLVGDELTVADAGLGGGGAPNITITVATTGTYGKWFSILRSADEKYVGQYADDTFRIWSLIDGNPRKVDMGDSTGVPGACNLTNLQTDLTAYNTAIADTASKLTTLNTSQSAFTESNDGQSDTKSQTWLTAQSYDENLGTTDEVLTTGILQQSADDAYTVKKDGNVVSTSDNVITSPVYKLEQTENGDGYSSAIGKGPANLLHIAAAGSGYSAVAAAATSGGSGSGLTLTTTVSAGALATATINAIGQGYRVGDLLTVAGGTSGQVRIDKVLPGSVYKLAVTVAGSGYTAAAANATTGGGTGLTVTTTVVAGAITAAVVNAPGNNYDIDDEITVSGGGGNARLRVVQLGNATTSDANGTELVLNVTSNSTGSLADLVTPADTNEVATFTHNGVADANRKRGEYTDISGTSSKVGTGALFDISVGLDGIPTITLVRGGTAYYAGETITIADSSIGNGGGASIVITIGTTKIVRSGGGNTSTTGYKVDEIVTVVGPAAVKTFGAITTGGTGYTNGTAVGTSVSPAGGSGLTVNTTVNVGIPQTITHTSGGTGYAAGSGINTTGGTGSGLRLNFSVTGGVVQATPAIHTAGTGYTVGDVVTITNANATGAKTLGPITTPGTGYADGTGIATSGGSGSGLTVNLTTTAGVVTGVAINNDGLNYTASDTVTITNANASGVKALSSLSTGGTGYSDGSGVATTSSGSGSGLTVDIVTTGGVITSATINNDGLNYAVDEVITISTGGGNAQLTVTAIHGNGCTIPISELHGNGAPATIATVQGPITGVTVNNPGDTYTVGDVITISGGGGNAQLPVATIDSAKYKVTELTWQKGQDRTSEHPTLASNGFKLYDLIEVAAPSHTDAALTTTTTAMGTAQTNYNNAVTAEATAKGNYDSEVTACVIPGLPDDGYLRGATADDIELVTLNDNTYVLNKNKTVSFTDDVTDPASTDAFVVVAISSYNSKYEIKLNGVTINYTTAQDSSAGDADATVIVSNLVTAINGAGGAAASCVATAVGAGIHITLVTSITSSGGPQSNAIYCFTNQLSDSSLLPLECVHKYKVKVINSINIDADDCWFEFSSSATDYSSGAGAWVESNEPAIQYKIDPATMPHLITRETDGSFKYQSIAWENRDVGDSVTNEKPSFIGTTIRNMFFFRNRFGFLSGSNVILSKAGSFYDFWGTSAQVSADDDPIDISASSTKPVFLNYVKTTSAGLVLFSDTEQFLLSTDSDILSPESSKVNTLSDYECDTDIPALNLGTSLAFVSKTPLYARLFEIANISTTDPPTAFNTTGIVPELVPSTIDNVTGSPGMSMISLGTVGSTTLYQYRFYQTAEKRIASTWYKWDLTGNLIDQFFDKSTFYAVISDGTNISVVSFDLRQASEEGFLTLPTGEKTDVCMDMYNINPYRVYDEPTEKTKVYLPFTHHTGKTLAVVALGGYIGGTLGATEASVGAILYPSVIGSAPNEYVEIDGDYRGKNLIIGYTYTMTVDLPKLYYQRGGEEQGKGDYTSDLIIHRIKVSTGLSGPIKYNINLIGIPDRSQTISAIKPYTYTANDVAMAAEGVHEVPVFQRNENISFSIVGDTPLPVSLLGMTWEGKYNNKFYSRV